MSKNNNKDTEQCTLHSVISRAFSFSFLPKWMNDVREANSELIEEMAKTRAVLGKKKTEELVIKFRNDAYQQTGVNHIYIINKLRAARHGL